MRGLMNEMEEIGRPEVWISWMMRCRQGALVQPMASTASSTSAFTRTVTSVMNPVTPSAPASNARSSPANRRVSPLGSTARALTTLSAK